MQRDCCMQYSLLQQLNETQNKLHNLKELKLLKALQLTYWCFQVAISHICAILRSRLEHSLIMDSILSKV